MPPASPAHRAESPAELLWPPQDSLPVRAEDSAKTRQDAVHLDDFSSRLNQTGLALLLQLSTAGACNALHRQGTWPQLQKELAALRPNELRTLADRWQSFCSLHLDCDQALKQLRAVRAMLREQDCIDCLIALKAPFAMMSQLCGLDWQSYLRRGGSCHPGRPRQPSPAEADSIERALAAVLGEQGDSDKAEPQPLNCFQWLALARLTPKIPLRISWGYRRINPC